MNFIFSKITNSRLMGSMGLILCTENEGDTIYKYFLLDSEGLGITDYVSLINPSDNEKHMEEERLMGGLGSDRIYLAEKEALGIINHFGKKTLIWEKELAGEVDEYIDIINDDKNTIDIYSLHEKICKPINDEVEFVNYMSMRFIARDREALSYFCENENISNMYITQINGTLLKTNVVSKGSGKYIVDCIYEDADGYYGCKLAMNIRNMDSEYRVLSILVSDIEGIYDFEVFDEISKSEYIAIYDLNDIGSEDLSDIIYKDSPFMLRSEMDEGTFFTRFNFNNDHVNKSTYVINNDIKSIYYVMEDKLFVGTYNDRDRRFINKLMQSKYKGFIRLDSELYFEENLLYEFAESGSTDIYDFLDV